MYLVIIAYNFAVAFIKHSFPRFIYLFYPWQICF